MRVSLLRGLGLSSALLLAACAGLPDRHSAPPDAAAERAQALALLPQQSLDLESAIRLALVNNPDAWAVAARIDLAEVARWQSRRPDNPRLDLGWLRPDADDESTQRSAGIEFSLAELIWLPQRRALGETAYQRALAQSQASALRLSLQVERQWYRLLAARSKQQLAEQIATVSDLSARLAERFHQAGNLPSLELQRQRASASRARIARLQTAQALRREQAELARLLGLGPADQWQTDAQLALPAESGLPTADQALQQALRQRADLQAQRLGLQAAEDALQWTRRWRWLAELELGYEVERESDGAYLRGPQLSLSLPLFDQGQGRLREAEARQATQSAALAAGELDARHQLAEALSALAEQQQMIDEYRDQLLRSQRAIVEGEQRRYDFMLAGAFDLLQAKAEELELREGYIDAVLDYWLARSELSAAVGERLPAAAGEPVDPPAAAAADSNHDPHAHHHGHAAPPATESPQPSPGPAEHSHGQPAPAADDPHSHHSHGGQP